MSFSSFLLRGSVFSFLSFFPVTDCSYDAGLHRLPRFFFFLKWTLSTFQEYLPTIIPAHVNFVEYMGTIMRSFFFFRVLIIRVHSPSKIRCPWVTVPAISWDKSYLHWKFLIWTIHLGSYAAQSSHWWVVKWTADFNWRRWSGWGRGGGSAYLDQTPLITCKQGYSYEVWSNWKKVSHLLSWHARASTGKGSLERITRNWKRKNKYVITSLLECTPCRLSSIVLFIKGIDRWRGLVKVLNKDWRF